MTNRKRYIYGLINPLTNKIFYIGQTNNLARRMSEHLLDDSGSYKSLVIQQLRELNLVFSIIILQEVDESIVDIAETNWINVCLTAGIELTNSASPSTSLLQPKKDRLLDKFSLEFNNDLVGQTILYETYEIDAIYAFGDFKWTVFKTGDWQKGVPTLSIEKFDRFISTLRIEANCRADNVLIKYIEKRVSHIVANGFTLLYAPIYYINEEHIEILRKDFLTSTMNFRYLLTTINYHNILQCEKDVPTVEELYQTFLTLSELFDIYTEFRDFDKFLKEVKETFDTNWAFIRALNT